MKGNRTRNAIIREYLAAYPSMFGSTRQERARSVKGWRAIGRKYKMSETLQNALNRANPEIYLPIHSHTPDSSIYLNPWGAHG